MFQSCTVLISFVTCNASIDIFFFFPILFIPYRTLGKLEIWGKYVDLRENRCAVNSDLFIISDLNRCANCCNGKRKNINSKYEYIDLIAY